MLLDETTVLDALDDYGIRDLTSPIPVVGLKGIIKDAAIFVSSHFLFDGAKTDPESIYAFPRSGINEEYPDSYTPECVNEAQLYFIVETFKNCSGQENLNLGTAEFVTKMGSTWEEKTLSTNPHYLKILWMLSDYLVNEGNQEFTVI